MLRRKYRKFLHVFQYLPGKMLRQRNPLQLIAKEFKPHHPIRKVRRIDLDSIPQHLELPTLEVQRRSRELHIYESPE